MRNAPDTHDCCMCWHAYHRGGRLYFGRKKREANQVNALECQNANLKREIDALRGD